MTQSLSSSNLSTPSKPPRSADEKLSVAVRIRPLRHNEHQRIIHVVDDKTVVLEEDSDNKNDVLRQKRGGERHYTYDSAFGEDSTQEEVYVATSRVLVTDVLNGYNATVFAYGATGSGKTYTMVGTPEQPGIMVRALNDLFLAVHHSSHPDRYAVIMSYLEIYNENIRDLLNPGSGFLELREDSRGRNIKVAGLTEISTISTQEVMHLLQKGNKARTVEPTAANKTSSRSHALLSVTVRQSYSVENHDKIRSRLKQGKLFMIDLAGSERASNTKNRGKRLQEGAHINRSLLALGNCINALSGGARYVNYRDSKLTRLLKDALSGNCRTVMIAHVSPASVHREESRTTLLYADRAKNISKKVERNILDVSYHVSQYRNIINELRQEISRLRTKMSEESPRTIETNNRHGEQLKLIREQIISTFREQMKLRRAWKTRRLNIAVSLRRQLMELDGQLLGLGAEAERQHLLISQWESMNNKLYGHTSSGWRPSTDPGFDTDRDISDSESADSALQQAWAELSFIEKEQERCLELRVKVERELEEIREKAARLEEELPTRVSSADEREVLALICRVHELEADKVALQSERLVKQHELRRRDLVILRFDRQRQICEEIITRQRQLMEEGSLKLPADLQELYRIYQQEIHAGTYPEYTPFYQSSYSSYIRERHKERLPPITQSAEPLFQRSIRLNGTDGGLLSRMDSEISLTTPISSAGSEYGSSPLPPINGHDVPGRARQHPPPAVLFPPILGTVKDSTHPSRPDTLSTHNKNGIPVSRLPRPLPKHSAKSLRRTASDDNLTASAGKIRSEHNWGKGTYHS